MDIRRKSFQFSKQSIALSSKAIRDFQEVYFLEYGIRLTPQQAETAGLHFLQFMKHILKPIPINIEKKTMENNLWKTKDLYLAAYIYSQQVELAKVGREDRTCWFYFRNELRCEELQSLYWSNKGNTVPKIYADAARSLKDLIFAT